MSKQIFTMPKNDGFFPCFQSNKHEKIWLVWPEKTNNWRMKAQIIQQKYVEIINELAKISVDINLLVSKNQFSHVRKILPDNVTIIEMTTNECFIKDYGPYFLFNKEKNEYRGLKSLYNAHGGDKYGSYYPYNADNLVAYKIFELEKIKYYEIPIYLNWGMILISEDGVCFASEQGILSDIHNKNLTKIQAEHYLKNYLNVKKIIWITYGFPYDVSKGRIDDILTIIDSRTILLSWTEDENDERYKVVQEAYKIIKKSSNISNEKYKIYKINLPKLIYMTPQESNSFDFDYYGNNKLFSFPIVTSYTSLYFNDKVALVPLFNEETDQENKIIFKKVFSKKVLIYVESKEIFLGNASLQKIICFKG